MKNRVYCKTVTNQILRSVVYCGTIVSAVTALSVHAVHCPRLINDLIVRKKIIFTRNRQLLGGNKNCS